MIAHRFFDGFTLNAAELFALIKTAFADTGVNGNDLIFVDFRQLTGHPFDSIVILAENYATMLQPGFAVGRKLGQKPFNSVELRIDCFGARKLVFDFLQACNLF